MVYPLDTCQLPVDAKRYCPPILVAAIKHVTVTVQRRQWDTSTCPLNCLCH